MWLVWAWGKAGSTAKDAWKLEADGGPARIPGHPAGWLLFPSWPSSTRCVSTCPDAIPRGSESHSWGGTYNSSVKSPQVTGKDAPWLRITAFKSQEAIFWHLHPLLEGSKMFLKKFIYWFVKNTMHQNPRPYNSRVLNKATIILFIYKQGLKIYLY